MNNICATKLKSGLMKLKTITAVNQRVRRSIANNSPFTRFFSDAIRLDENNIDDSDDDTDLSDNELFSPVSFTVVSRLMPYFPLWSAVLLEHAETKLPLSNANAESHFRNLKHSTLNKQRNIRPRDIVVKELTFVRAKVNEQLLNNAGR